jgi:two-component system LytT family response regulator
MKAIIVDDEGMARREMRRLLAVHPEVEIGGEARDAEEAFALIQQEQPDLVFLDVQMPGASGFDLLERLEELPQIIFTTAYDEYALKAFEVSALDYLLKPIAPARLAAALQKVRPRSVPKRLEQVFVREGERCWLVRMADIFLLESEGNYTRIYFRKERPLVPRSLASLEERLDPASFFRADRGRILNLKWVDQVETAVSGNLMVTLKSGVAVELSRRQSVRFREVLGV